MSLIKHSYFISTLFISIYIILIITKGITSKRIINYNNQEFKLRKQIEKYSIGSIGCTFSDSVCDLNVEYCYNDNAFGRCIGSYGVPSKEETYKYNLDGDDVGILEIAMESLFENGFRWTHSYTQCVLQNLLLNIRKREGVLEEVDCVEDEMINENGNDSIELEFLEPREKYIEIDDNIPRIYYEKLDDEELENVNEIPKEEGNDYYNFKNSKEESGDLDDYLSEVGERERESDYDSEWKDENIDPILLNSVQEKKEIDIYPKIFSLDYNTPDSFRKGKETRDEAEFLIDPIYNPSNIQSLSELSDSDIENLLLEEEKEEPLPTEGGLLFIKNPKRFLLDENNSEYHPGFTRSERLDVKKPGPWYKSVNNYGFDKKYQNIKQEKDSGGGDGINNQKDDNDEVNQLNLIKKAGSSIEASKLAESVPGSPFEIIDTSYVTLRLQNRIGSWNGGRELVNLIADLLDIKHTTFTEVRLPQSNIITFKVGLNDKGYNALEVARKIDNFKSVVERESGLGIDSVVGGIKSNSEVRISEPLELLDESIVGKKGIYVGVFAMVGIVAAILISSFIILIIRKSAKSRDKLRKLSQDDHAMESCKDYQELCRARMASKSNEKVEPIRAVQRVQSGVSRDSEGTSSSRSSTSSWSEEPVLTNMDISTGHMVLSYMEDHLKKKDRLDQEWAGLCTYEADPGSTLIAQKPENGKKNRYPNSLPYDHNRVILSDIHNINGGDYINASTITDHDPRNPAYISTQGPLPNTTSDFWQMVWEQGSVVIVNLTKLNENGTTLCHRYWPEEGSELHHIYEVHLVSEHIWCEEYLVRSFYLKNLKTGETRTVTQFHFLAWPENGIPTSAKSLLEFRRKVNKSYRGRSCPVIVHDSDGCGRAGTYCLIDMVLNRMTKGAKEIDISATLEHIRDQRGNAVHTKQQFEFVLIAVAEEVHAILKALPQ